jgi:hypothetical protein
MNLKVIVSLIRAEFKRAPTIVTVNHRICVSFQTDK